MAGAVFNTGLTVKSLVHLVSLYSPLTANRETAFVHAISSAGVMYTLTRNCSLGDFDNCGCDDSRNGQLGKERRAAVPLSRPRRQETVLLLSSAEACRNNSSSWSPHLEIMPRAELCLAQTKVALWKIMGLPPIYTS